MGWQWMPVLDITKVRKASDQKYWPIFVHDGTLVYTLLVGVKEPELTYHFPGVPAKEKLKSFPSVEVVMNGQRIKEKDIKIDIKVQYDNIMWNEATHNHWEREQDYFGQTESQFMTQQKNYDKSILSLLQTSCQYQSVPLALSLSKKIKSSIGIKAGIKIANHFGQTAIANHCDSILQTRTDEAKSQQNCSIEAELEENAIEPTTDEQQPKIVQGRGVLTRKAEIRDKGQNIFPGKGSVVQLNVNPFAVIKTQVFEAAAIVSPPQKKKSNLANYFKTNSNPFKLETKSTINVRHFTYKIIYFN
jgi:hypothetical protein